MTASWQNLLVLAFVAFAAAVVFWQLFSTLRGKGGGVGSCCSKGCSTHEKPKSPGNRVVFLPVENLRKSK